MRVRVTFHKTAAMRYTGHLDLFRTWERTIRRAGLPLSYSEGFTPRPKMHLAAALPLGFTSICELLDVWLDVDLPLPEVEAALKSAAPPGIFIRGLAAIAASEKKLQTLVDSAEYHALLLDPAPANLREQIAALLASESVPRTRRDKPYDLRPLLLGLAARPLDAEGRAALWMHLRARESATGRPEEVLLALGIAPDTARVERTALHFAEDPVSI
ncbi:MAG: TIGR03936 family radical SAM-associated protein [Anaerolineales bacterium]